MPTALFFNVPAHGHMNPSLPLTAELVRRGHQITYYATQSYQPRIAATGATFHPYGAQVEDNYFADRGLDGTAPQRSALALAETTRSILPELLLQAKALQPDYILYDCMCPWGYYVGQILKLPTVASYSLLPLAPRLLRDWHFLRLVLPMLLKDLSSGIRAGRLLRALGRQYQVTPLNQTNVLSAPGDLCISYSSPEFVPFAESLPHNFRFVGWTPPEAETGEAGKGANRRLIYISLGTVANENLGFFRACLEALADLDCDVLMSTGGAFGPEHFAPVPENIELRPWVPQLAALGRADLFISHAGINSVTEALYYGVPLLLVPQQTEQTFTARRVAELGAGRILEKDEATCEGIRTEVKRLLNNAHYARAAERMGGSLRAAGGVSQAADAIESRLADAKPGGSVGNKGPHPDRRCAD